jgi:aspartyl-tRNA(Asn)/glutamyl-tRNA(Gln) amidotransferase subunit A
VATDSSLADIVRALRRHTLSSHDLTERAIARHELFGGKLNAYRTFAPDMARSRAEAADRAFAAGQDLGPLQGIPVSIKDLFGVAGSPATPARRGGCRTDGSGRGRWWRQSSASAP